MERLKIAVLIGGDSSEAIISHRSGHQVFDSLDRTLYNPMLVNISKEGWYAVETHQKVDKNDFSVGGIRFDYALIVIHGTPGENGILQGYLDLMQVPYSSCSVEVSALTFNKYLCKLALLDTPEMRFARHLVIGPSQTVDAQMVVAELGLPVFVKPNASGSSFGVTKVKRAEDLQRAIDEALREGEVVLIEEYIEGVEISQGVMICGSEQFVLPITELASHTEFFDYQAKYTPGMAEEITPARISDIAASRTSTASLAAYRSLGCSGVVRIDYIIKDDHPYFIEVNSVPGMSAQSIVPQQWRHAGLSMGEAYTKIIESTRR